MLVDSFRKVRHAVLTAAFNEVDEVDRPQPGGAGCGCSSQPAKTLCLADNKLPPKLSAVRAVELKGLRKKSSGFLPRPGRDARSTRQAAAFANATACQGMPVLDATVSRFPFNAATL